MTVYVFGNSDLADDSIPLMILPELREKLPDIQFEVRDPNEEWEIPESITAIDTVLGLDDVRVFDDLDYFKRSPHLTLHDFDALANLLFLEKLGKLKRIKIIGVPPTIPGEQAVEKISAILRAS